MMYDKRFEIRNSLAEFQIFQNEGKEDGMKVICRDESIWCTLKDMDKLFDVEVPAISKHLNNIFPEGELQQDSTISKMKIVQNLDIYQVEIKAR